MSKLDRFRYGNLHKRRLFVVLGVFVILLMFAVGILFSIGAFGDRSKLVRISVTNGRTGNTTNGVGINLDYIPTSNRVRDPSFENSFAYESFSVAATDPGCIFINPHETSSIVTGSTVKVYSVGGNDNLSCIYESTVAGYDALSFGQVSAIALDGSLAIDKTVVIDNVIDALTTDGRIVTDLVSDQNGSVLGVENSVFVDIASIGNNVYAISADGQCFSSNDGHTFSLIAEYDGELDGDIKLLGAGGAVGALYDNSLLILTGSDIIRYDLPFESNVVAASYDAGRTILFTEEGDAYITSNLIAYEKLDEVSIPEIVDVITTTNSFFAIHSTGAITVISIDEQGNVALNELEADNTSLRSGYVNAVGYEDGIIAINTSQSAYLITPNNGIKSLSGESASIDRVFVGLGSRILYQDDNEVFSAQLLAGIRVFETIGDGLISSGDLVTVGNRVNPVSLTSIADDGWQVADNGNVWDVYGEGSTLSAITSDEATGDYCARLVGSTDNYHVLSQELLGTTEQTFEDGAFYRMEVKLKQENVFTPVRIWLSGYELDTIGFTIDDVGSRFNTYSYVFVIPGSMIGDHDFRFNIGFEGTGTLYIDGIYLGEDRYNIAAVDENFKNSIANANPSAIRLNNLRFGSDGYAESAFYGSMANSTVEVIDGVSLSGCQSLEQSLRLVRDAESDPWIVIGSNVTPGDINNLMDYLCGFNSSEYSQLRVNNGTSMPWIQQFDNIYFEINDDNGMFKNDLQRGAYVSYVINLIEQSDYYVDLRDRLVFVDGMEYEGDAMLSNADFHSEYMNINTGDVTEEQTINDYCLEMYLDASHDAPRQTTGVFVSSLDINSDIELTAADIVAMLYNDNSTYINMTMVNIADNGLPYSDEEIDAINNDTILRVIGALEDVREAGYYMYEINDPAGEDATDTAEAFGQHTSVTCLAGNGGRILIVANISDTQQQFIVEGAGNFSINSVDRYNERCNPITTNRFGIDSSRQVIQAGQFVVIECN